MSKRLPDRPTLRHLRNQAKRLLKAHRSGDPQALQRITKSHPRLGKLSPDEVLSHRFGLRSAQVVVAREYGFPSWPKLVTHVEGSEVQHIADGRELRTDFPSLANVSLTEARVVDLWQESTDQFEVALRSDSGYVVRIIIGKTEGFALVLALLKETTPRPLTHSLVYDLLERSGADLEVVGTVIHRLVDSTFHALLLFRTESGPSELDCRPSDGLVLATMKGARVWVASEVIEKAGIKVASDEAAEARRAEKEALERLQVDGPHEWIELPFRFLKSRVIGKDGRNIRAFEAATGVRVETDVMPKRLLLAAQDQEKLEAAAGRMRQVIAEGPLTPEAFGVMTVYRGSTAGLEPAD